MQQTRRSDYGGKRAWTKDFVPVDYRTSTIFKPTNDDRQILDLSGIYFAAARMERLMAARNKKIDSVHATLTRREELSLIRYALGDREQEIADRLGVSTGRVNAARQKLKASHDRKQYGSRFEFPKVLV